MRTIKVAFLCFIMILSAAVTVLKFERNYYYGDMTHPQELSSLSFFFKYDRNSTVDLLSWHTTVYSAYFNVLSHQTLRLWYKDIENFGGNISRVAFSLSESINKSHAVITGMRDQYDLVGKNSSQLLETVDQTMISPYFDAMYSNGNYVIYSRP